MPSWRPGAWREVLALTSRARDHLAQLREGFERSLEELLVEIAAARDLLAG